MTKKKKTLKKRGGRLVIAPVSTLSLRAAGGVNTRVETDLTLVSDATGESVAKGFKSSCSQKVGFIVPGSNQEETRDIKNLKLKRKTGWGQNFVHRKSGKFLGMGTPKIGSLRFLENKMKEAQMKASDDGCTADTKKDLKEAVKEWAKKNPKEFLNYDTAVLVQNKIINQAELNVLKTRCLVSEEVRGKDVEGIMRQLENGVEGALNTLERLEIMSSLTDIEKLSGEVANLEVNQACLRVRIVLSEDPVLKSRYTQESTKCQKQLDQAKIDLNKEKLALSELLNSEDEQERKKGFEALGMNSEYTEEFAKEIKELQLTGTGFEKVKDRIRWEGLTPDQKLAVIQSAVNDGCKGMKKLGQGAFGKVMKYEVGSKSYAVKVPIHNKNGTKYEQIQQREYIMEDIKLEKKAMTTCFPERVHGTFEDSDGFENLVIECYEGSNLDVTLHENKETLDKMQQFYVLKGVCTDLKTMHDKGYMHRDIKSPNIMVSGEGNQTSGKLIDLGLATEHESDKKATHTGCGTLWWMAPEVLKGETYDKSVDIYSLGIVMYELLTGELPFQNQKITSPHVLAKYVALEEGRPSWPANVPKDNPLRQLAEKCWAQNPDQRPNIDEVLEQLEGIEGKF